MAKAKISKVERVIGTDKTSVFIDDDIIVSMSDSAKQKFILYLRSIIRSIEYYAGEEEKQEVAYLSPRSLSMYNIIIRCKTKIEMIGYKDEDYILIKFRFASCYMPSTIKPVPGKDIYLSLDDAKQLIKDLNV